ncbi:hypothetical protein DL240_16910 [Lujinxingia litoralis]|uniref:Uncharacterized protein n=1 Tax=Lujinxingia litoralis TaxID=2211119 RepID=A0A328C3I7_9DELT|nr:glycosyltransferase family 4 protein [Lujinxingia litoralis]RAL20485.1 hypothetical protein DL240_16910 [Lujinxingia litoralis]
MRAIFVHDSVFYIRGDRVFVPGTPDRRSWEPYLQVFDELLVAGRCRSESSPAGAARADRAGVHFECLPDLASPRRWVTHLPAALARLEALIAPADLVIARTSVLGNLAAFCALRAEKRLLLEVVGCPLGAYWHHGSISGKIYAPIAALQTRALAARAPFVHYVTREYLQRRYPSSGVTLAMSDARIEMPEPGVLERRRERITLLDRRTGPWRVGMIGAYDLHYKGLDVLLEAAARLRDTLPMTLHITGAGDPAPWLARAAEAGLAGRLHFEGVLPPERVLDWFDTLDLYVQPSREEALPRSVVEALSRGLPVLASSVGGLPELLSPAALHPPGDAAMLAAQMDALLRDPGAQHQAYERAIETARRFVGPDKDARYQRFLRQAAGLS